MPSPFLYFPGERLSLAELSAARMDGHVVELGEGYIPADAIESREMRAASLERLLGERLAAALETAAWIHGAIDEPPARHSVCRAVPERVGDLLGRRAAFVDLVLREGDLLRVGAVRVTSRARTLADLARHAGRGTGRRADALAAAARGFLARGIVSGDEARRVLHAGGRLPAGGRAALRLLDALEAEPAGAGQAEVTRYTS